MIIKAPIDLELTQLSGQTSQPPWKQVDGSFRDVVMVNDNPVLFDVKQSGENMDFNFTGNITEKEAISKLNYIYDLDFDLDKFYKYLQSHAELQEMSEFCNGLRLFLAKDPFECIISSICSANNSNKKMDKICQRYERKMGNQLF
jgi:3-methyladenine DNA glycosylase/8-oxoguanine DNA glycosylase